MHVARSSNAQRHPARTTWRRRPLLGGAGLVGLAAIACIAGGLPAASAGAQQTARQLNMPTLSGNRLFMPRVSQPRAAPNGTLNAVSCVGASFCMAVGIQAPIWNGTSWKASTLPSPAGTVQRFLLGVSCTSDTACVVVGQYETTSGDFPLAESWNGTAWTIETPHPFAGPATGFNAVSCHAADFCVAVGYYTNSESAPQPMSEIWNGKKWVPKTTELAGDESSLTSISCTSTKFCMASGWYDTTATSRSLAESWGGKTWTLQAPPVPSGSTLNSISCASSTYCVGVGTHGNDPGAPFAAIWSDSVWITRDPPMPPGGTLGILYGVSCHLVEECVAVGEAQDPSAITLGEDLNGKTWAVADTATPASSSQPNLGAVFCIATTVCDAVGGFIDSAATRLPLAESWNGITPWRITAT